MFKNIFEKINNSKNKCLDIKEEIEKIPKVNAFRKNKEEVSPRERLLKEEDKENIKLKELQEEAVLENQ